MNDYRPIMRVGGTVMLAPEFRRVGMYLAGLQEYQPYRVLRLEGERITLQTENGPRVFKVHCFDPVSCKYALFDKVKIYNRKRKVFSAAMTVRHYSRQNGYTLSNGQMYDVSVLVSVKDAVDSIPVFESKRKIEQQLLNI